MSDGEALSGLRSNFKGIVSKSVVPEINNQSHTHVGRVTSRLSAHG